MSEFIDKIRYDKMKKDISKGEGKYSRSYTLDDAIKIELSLVKKTGMTFKPPFFYRYTITVTAKDIVDEAILRSKTYKDVSLKNASSMFELHSKDIVAKGGKLVKDKEKEGK